MIYASLFLFLLLIVLDRAHSMSVSTKVLRSQCRLFEIRDHLREGVATGAINPSHWVFQYLDSTIVKTIDALDKLTLWRIIGVALGGYSESTVKAVGILEAELSKPGNEYARRVYVMYHAIVTCHVFDRSALLKALLHGMMGLGVIRSFVERQFQRVGKITAAASETSTLVDFAPA